MSRAASWFESESELPQFIRLSPQPVSGFEFDAGDRFSESAAFSESLGPALSSAVGFPSGSAGDVEVPDWSAFVPPLEPLPPLDPKNELRREPNDALLG